MKFSVIKQYEAPAFWTKYRTLLTGSEYPWSIGTNIWTKLHVGTGEYNVRDNHVFSTSGHKDIKKVFRNYVHT